jgi:predicted phage-related endonuclease
MRRKKHARGKGGTFYVQEQVRTEPADLANTILKMANKRAKMAMVLNVTAASDCFAQDLEDMDDALRDHLARHEATRRRRTKQQAEREVWPDEAFEKQLPKMLKAIANGKSADEIIAWAESKGALTEQQKARIRGGKQGRAPRAPRPRSPRSPTRSPRPRPRQARHRRRPHPPSARRAAARRAAGEVRRARRRTHPQGLTMKTHNHAQGSDSWHAHRAQCFNASDAPAMLGMLALQHARRLAARVRHGLRPKSTPARSAASTMGTASKRSPARWPSRSSATTSRPSWAARTSASPGRWAHRSTAHDARRHVLRAQDAQRRACGPCLRQRRSGAHLPNHYRAQMEQQLLVSGATRVLFMATKWDGDDCVEAKHCWYESDKGLRKQLLVGWKQFDADLAAYEPGEAAPTPPSPRPSKPCRRSPRASKGSWRCTATSTPSGPKLRGFISKIPEKPTTDQEFADCDAACKALKKAEDALDGAESSALGQVQSVEVLTRTIADLRNVARTARLASEKVVKARKEQIRLDEVQRGKRALEAHVHKLNEQIGQPFMPAVAADFGAVISGKKTWTPCAPPSTSCWPTRRSRRTTSPGASP